MPDARTVLPAPKLLDLIGIRDTENAITLAARTSSRVARCPACGRRSARVHSHYTRMLADLPWQGIPVTVRLRVRRFFCDHRRLATKRSLLSPCLVSPHATRSQDRAARRLVRQRVLYASAA
jgi:transposase